MTDTNDLETEHNEKPNGKRKYTRCSYCGMFWQMELGTPCPSGDGGMME